MPSSVISHFLLRLSRRVVEITKKEKEKERLTFCKIALMALSLHLS